MRVKTAWVCCAFVAIISSNLLAGGGFTHSFLNLHRCWPNAVGKFCCDDYDCKPLPKSKPICNFTCDDYCPKPLPCAQPVCSFCCDDYCGKPFPEVSCPPSDLQCIPYRLPCCVCEDTPAKASTVDIESALRSPPSMPPLPPQLSTSPSADPSDPLNRPADVLLEAHAFPLLPLPPVE